MYRQVLTYRNTAVSLRGRTEETERECCHSDPVSAESDAWQQVHPLWACPLSPWQWIEAGSAADYLQAAGHTGTLNMADRCRLEGKCRTTLPTVPSC